MLNRTNAMATIAVKDLARARAFYEGQLGLEPAEPPEAHMVTLRSGESLLTVYESAYAGTNQATAATWDVGEGLEQLVTELKQRGVQFEHYDLPGVVREGDIHRLGGRGAAWCKDPDGNILCFAQG